MKRLLTRGDVEMLKYMVTAPKCVTCGGTYRVNTENGQCVICEDEARRFPADPPAEDN